jgi:hypothetical protein
VTADDLPADHYRRAFLAALRRPAEVDPGAGAGAVILGGGLCGYGAFVACRLLRATGWPHPIQVWAGGAVGPPPPVAAFRPVDAEVVVLAGGPDHPWACKPYAVAAAPFARVLYLDADAYPVVDVTPLVAAPPPVGAWPDPFGDPLRWWATGVDRPAGDVRPQGGALVFDKAAAAAELAAWVHLNAAWRYWYSVGWSDQECLQLACAAAGRPAAPLGRPCGHLAAGVMSQPDHAGGCVVVHRAGAKFLPDGGGTWAGRAVGAAPQVPREAEAWAAYAEALGRLGTVSSWSAGGSGTRSRRRRSSAT